MNNNTLYFLRMPNTKSRICKQCSLIVKNDSLERFEYHQMLGIFFNNEDFIKVASLNEFQELR